MRLDEVETFHDFGKFLRELAKTDEGRLFYMPLHLKFDQLLENYRWTLRLALIFGFILGTIFGLALPL